MSPGRNLYLADHVARDISILTLLNPYPSDYSRIVSALEANLARPRFLHTLGVTQTAIHLAKLYGADLVMVTTAALLHDCAKGMPKTKIEAWISEGRFNLKAGDIDFPAIWHGPAGAVAAKADFGVDDEIVLDAIENHTLGHDHPSLVLRLLMAADATEPTRDYPGIELYRKLIRDDLNTGLLAILQAKTQHVIDKGQPVHPRMQETIGWLEKQ
jgi:predicted HD superfamily hydrolase involved in NAD metabolism